MATPADLALVDTNVLIYSLLQADPHHGHADRRKPPGHGFWQVLCFGYVDRRAAS